MSDMWMKGSYDDHEARQDECQGCQRAAADIGDLCERCYVEAVMDQADEHAALGAYLAKLQADQANEEAETA